MNCDDYTESLNALLDGELPPDQAAPLVTHLASCPACAHRLAEFAELRAGLAQMLPEAEPSAELQAKIDALLAQEGAEIIPFTPKPRASIASRVSWFAVPALAAALMLALLPRHDETKDLMSVHDAALRTASLTTNATVPAPAVPGFTLVSNHMDVVAGRMAQVASYVKDGQNVVLCIWPANGEPAHGVRQAVYAGMTIKYWNDGDHEYWAAGTTPGDHLDKFVNALVVSS